MKKIGLLAAALLLTANVTRAEETAHPQLLLAMRAELDRSLQRLKLPGYEAPYFVSYLVHEYQNRSYVGKFGAIVDDNNDRSRGAYVEVRVGNYQLDNSANDRDANIEMADFDLYEPSTRIALEDEPQSLRATLWLLTDAKYKHALAAYAKKRGRRATNIVEDEGLPSFAREPKAIAIEPIPPFDFDEAAAKARTQRLSALFKNDPEIFDASVRIGVDRVVRYYVNSEGSELVGVRTIYSTLLQAATRAKDGMLIEHEKSFYGRVPSDLPDEKKLAQEVQGLTDELAALRKAPLVDPYTGPALLMEQAAGVFFHEAVGHRLEGERQNDEKEGRTFKGQVGKTVLPTFLSVLDDPTMQRVGDVALNGYYKYDDEGIVARPVTLIDHGVLRDYIMSRTPIVGSIHSNGHGRSEGTADPMGRMGNIVVRSDKQFSIDELKKKLLEEVRRQGKPFGLIITDIAGGSTNTSNYGYQAFKGEPRLVYRVDAKTGKETLVRGVEMVGTPLTTVSKILATSNTLGVFNGFCGAESGYVPVSTVAPAVLMQEIELQRTQRALERAPILPAPWAPDKATHK